MSNQADINKCRSVLRAAMRDQQRLMAWDLDKGHLKSFDLKIKDITRSETEILLVPSSFAVDWTDVQSMVRGSGLMNFFLEKSGLLFRSELIALERDFLVIRFPRLWSFEDRRQSERFLGLNNIYLNIVKSDKPKSFKVFDLSYSGLSVIVSSADSFRFKSGEIIKKAFVTIAKNRIPVELEVVNDQKVTPYQFEEIPFTGRRYGFKFSNEIEIIKNYLDDMAEKEKSSKI